MPKIQISAPSAPISPPATPCAYFITELSVLAQFSPSLARLKHLLRPPTRTKPAKHVLDRHKDAQFVRFLLQSGPVFHSVFV